MIKREIVSIYDLKPGDAFLTCYHYLGFNHYDFMDDSLFKECYKILGTTNKSYHHAMTH